MKSIYDYIFQLLNQPWNQYVQKYTECGRSVMDSFYYIIYPTSGVWLIIISLIFCFLFYYYFNYHYGRYYKIKWFIVFLVLNSLIVFLVTFGISYFNLHKFSCTLFSQYLSFGLINFFYSALLFFIISIIIKWWSPMGKRTPF